MPLYVALTLYKVSLTVNDEQLCKLRPNKTPAQIFLGHYLLYEKYLHFSKYIAISSQFISQSQENEIEFFMKYSQFKIATWTL